MSEVPPEQAQRWPKIKPLEPQYERLPYPIDALPEPIRHAVLELEAHVQAPIALIASSALGAISLAIQGHIDVARDKRLIGPVSLYLLSLGDSGERKTTIDGYFTKPIIDYEKRKELENLPELRQYNVDSASYCAKRSGIVAKIKELSKSGKVTCTQEAALRELESNAPVKPKVPKLLVNDSTQEALLYRLSQTWPQAGLFSDEGGSVFGSHAMGKESIMRNLSTLNSLWGGGRHQVERRSSESYKVNNPRFTVHIQVQVVALLEFLKVHGILARGSGFMARFLIADPLSTQGHRQYKEPTATTPALDAYNRRLTQILDKDIPFNEHGDLEPSVMQLSPDAKRVWVAFHDAVEHNLAKGCEFADISDAASKSADNAARLGALFAYFETGTPATEVSEKYMQSAIAVATWHLFETQRFFAKASTKQEQLEVASLNDWLISYCRSNHTDRLTRRDIQQRGPYTMRSTQTRDCALATLSDMGRVLLKRISKSEIVIVNPVLLKVVSQ